MTSPTPTGELVPTTHHGRPPARPLPTFESLFSALPAAEQAQVEQAVRTLNRTTLHAGLRTAVEVHRYVLDEFCDGRWDLYTNPRHSKRPAFEALCLHPDLAMSADALRVLVRVGEQLLHMDAQTAWSLSVDHHRVLLPLADPARRQQMAEVAIAEELTARQLSEAIAKTFPADKPRRGRKRTSTTVRHLAAAHKAFQGLDAERIAAEAAGWGERQRQVNRERARAWKALAERVLAALGE